MRDERVIYVAGHPLLNRRCTRLPGCIRLQNDLYCVEWGVKLYSLTHCKQCNNKSGLNICGRNSTVIETVIRSLIFYCSTSLCLLKRTLRTQHVSLSETEGIVKRCSTKVVKRLQLEVP